MFPIWEQASPGLPRLLPQQGRAGPPSFPVGPISRRAALREARGLARPLSPRNQARKDDQVHMRMVLVRMQNQSIAMLEGASTR